MGYILLVCLAIELLIIYIFNGRNVVSPSFLACASFILATCIYLTGDEYYGYELHTNTVVVIVSLLFCIFLGELFSNLLSAKSASKSDLTVRLHRPIRVNPFLCGCFAAAVLVFSLIRFREVYQFSLSVGNPAGNIWTMAKYVRTAKLSGMATFDLSVWASQGTVISKCVVYFCVYCIGWNKNNTGKFYWRFVWPILCYFPQIIASDNRTDLLNTLTICVIIAFVLIKQRNGWTSKGNLKIVVVSLVLVVAFFAIFRWLGYRTETSLRSEAWDNITEYTSAGLVGLDKFLQYGEAPNTLFGQWSLKGIYLILRQWGVPIPQVDRFEQFFVYAQGEANIYTGFKPYIKDYTMIGAGIAMFLWGVIISYSMKCIRQKGAGFVRVCWLGMMYYPVIMLSMDDTTSAVLGISTLYTFFYLILLDWVFVKRKIQFRLGD